MTTAEERCERSRETCVDRCESFLEFLHVNPHHHFVGVFLDAVHRVSDVRLWKIVVVASIYVILRFVEAYGLWYVRPWAEWLAIGSGSIYIPFEVKNLVRHPNQFHLVVLTINILVVLYIAWVRWDEVKAARAIQS